MAKFVVFEKVNESIYSVVDKNTTSGGMQTVYNLGSGLIAGFAAAIVSQPADTMLSKINKTKGLPGEGTTSRLIKIAKELGLRGSYGGIGARLFMVGTLTAGQFAIYGDIKKALGMFTSPFTSSWIIPNSTSQVPLVVLKSPRPTKLERREGGRHDTRTAMTIITEKSVSFAYGCHGFGSIVLFMCLRLFCTFYLDLPAFRLLDGNSCNSRRVGLAAQFTELITLRIIFMHLPSSLASETSSYSSLKVNHGPYLTPYKHRKRSSLGSSLSPPRRSLPTRPRSSQGT